MSDLNHTIESGGYVYHVAPTQPPGEGYLDINLLKCYLHFAEAFKRADDEWQAKENNDLSLRNYDAYLYSMTIAMAGVPIALIANVEDTVQVFGIPMGTKIEENPK